MTAYVPSSRWQTRSTCLSGATPPPCKALVLDRRVARRSRSSMRVLVDDIRIAQLGPHHHQAESLVGSRPCRLGGISRPRTGQKSEAHAPGSTCGKHLPSAEGDVRHGPQPADAATYVALTDAGRRHCQTG